MQAPWQSIFKGFQRGRLHAVVDPTWMCCGTCGLVRRGWWSRRAWFDHGGGGGGVGGTRISGGGFAMDGNESPGCPRQHCRRRSCLLYLIGLLCDGGDTTGQRCNDSAGAAMERFRLGHRDTPCAGWSHRVSLASVSCTSSSFCVVAGGIVFGSDGPLPALYQWNGSSWSGSSAAGVAQPICDGHVCGRLVHGADMVHGNGQRRQHHDEHHRHLRLAVERDRLDDRHDAEHHGPH